MRPSIWIRIGATLAGGGFIFSSGVSAAADLPFDPSQFADPSSLISPEICNSVIKTIGFGLDHRSYEGATPLGSAAGLDLGIEATGVTIPKEFNDALKKAGLSNSTIPILPVPRLHLHKGLGSRAGINFSYVRYKQFKLMGGDFKWAFHVPEEGPSFAFRISYSVTTIGFVETKTITPSVIVSKKLFFAEPYLGFGVQSTRGKIHFPLEVEGYKIELNASGGGIAYQALSGVQFNTPGLGLQLTLEGTYSSFGTHTLGTKVGLSF